MPVYSSGVARGLSPYSGRRRGRLVDRRQLLKRVDEAWEAFNESYTGLSDVQLLEPGVTGTWSVRDILAHVTTWEE